MRWSLNIRGSREAVTTAVRGAPVPEFVRDAILGLVNEPGNFPPYAPFDTVEVLGNGDDEVAGYAGVYLLEVSFSMENPDVTVKPVVPESPEDDQGLAPAMPAAPVTPADPPAAVPLPTEVAAPAAAPAEDPPGSL